jgi:hypothetical protein
MQGQNGGVNRYVVIFFSHYILSDKTDWNEKARPEHARQADGCELWKR